MIAKRIALGAAALAVVGGVALTVWAADISLGQIPEKAKAALLKLAGDNKIIEIESEKENGVQVFEAGWLVNGKPVEAEVTADGELLEMEAMVTDAEVPEAVRTAAQQALAGASRIHYEKHTVVFYEAEGRVDGKAKEVKISPAGQIDKENPEEAEEEGADDDDAEEQGK